MGGCYYFLVTAEGNTLIHVISAQLLFGSTVINKLAGGQCPNTRNPLGLVPTSLDFVFILEPTGRGMNLKSPESPQKMYWGCLGG